jgi:hypothetical protein
MDWQSRPGADTDEGLRIMAFGILYDFTGKDSL